MKDRLPLYPGRVKLVPVSGQENVYDMTRADQPTQAGDPLNKATLLKDATAALFGLGTDAVPDDALAYLGKYAQHWWKRWPARYEENKVSASSNLSAVVSSNTPENTNIMYSEKILIDDSGKISLQDAKSVPFTGDFLALKNSLISIGSSIYITGMAQVSDESVYFIEVAAWQRQDSWVYLDEAYFKLVESILKSNPSDYSFVNDNSQNAYPDSGVLDGYEYEYLGIPFDNAATAPKIATGSYVGTGKYGKDNPNSLTFEFPVKFVVIYASNSSNPTSDSAMFSVTFSPDFSFGKTDSISWHSGSSSKAINGIDWSNGNRTLSFYSNRSAGMQLNLSDKTYYYYAFG